LTKLKSHCC